MDDYVAPFTIGHHDSSRKLSSMVEIVNQAHAAGVGKSAGVVGFAANKSKYNFVTSPITTSHFHSRVLTLLSSFLSESANRGPEEVTSSYNASPVTIPALGPEDTPLSPNESVSQLLAYTSPWIDLCSLDPVIADISRQVLRLELQYAAFCGVTNILIQGPVPKPSRDRTDGVAKFARAILDSLSLGPYMQILVLVPMIDDSENHKEQLGHLAPFARAEYIEPDAEGHHIDLFAPWEAWNIIRSVCRYSTRLSVALSIPKLLPPTPIQSRWYSEPVRLLSLDSTIFVKNPKGYPVFSKAHQALISRFAHFKQPPAWLLLDNVGPVPLNNLDNTINTNDSHAFPTLAQSSATPLLKDPTPYLSYLRNLQTKQPSRSVADRFGAGYQDYLQAPLQPLTVNLESITYEVFEKDPIKYEWYERAVARALNDWIEQGKPTSNPDGRVVVAVVGAGRGPLVTRALQASEATGVDIDMWALEKNPNAFVLLQQHNQNIWSNAVSLVKSDMRTWTGPARQSDGKQIRRSYNIDPDIESEPTMPNEPHTDGHDPNTSQTIHYKIDILISELLGSFADNELSPECLDGVQHLLNPVHGISIPTSYTAHITPISAPKLHADISLNMIHTMPHAAETPYVVMLNAIDFLSTSNTTSQQNQSSHKTSHPGTQIAPPEDSQPNPIVHQTWAFHHPNPALPPITSAAPSNAHNARYTCVSFPVANRATCHGLAGYFETVLYPGVELSTNPLTMEQKSADMISWFPIFFPLKQPLCIPDASLLKVHMWRQTDDRKVWYEWLVDLYSISGSGPGPGPGPGTAKGSNPKANLVRIGGTELHSSEKEACLM